MYPDRLLVIQEWKDQYFEDWQFWTWMVPILIHPSSVDSSEPSSLMSFVTLLPAFEGGSHVSWAHIQREVKTRFLNSSSRTRSPGWLASLFLFMFPARGINWFLCCHFKIPEEAQQHPRPWSIWLSIPIRPQQQGQCIIHPHGTSSWTSASSPGAGEPHRRARSKGAFPEQLLNTKWLCIMKS